MQRALTFQRWLMPMVKERNGASSMSEVCFSTSELTLLIVLMVFGKTTENLKLRTQHLTVKISAFKFTILINYDFIRNLNSFPSLKFVDRLLTM